MKYGFHFAGAVALGLLAGSTGAAFAQDDSTLTAEQLAAKFKAQMTRNQALPDVPTTTEAGLPAYQVVVWNAMLAPKGTPAPVVARLNEALKAALADANVRARLAELGADLPTDVQATPAGLQAFIEAEIAKWTPVIKAAGVTASN